VCHLHHHLPQLEYCINGSHVLPLTVSASVVPVTIELSLDELHFEFSLDNWDTYIEKVGMRCCSCMSSRLCLDLLHDASLPALVMVANTRILSMQMPAIPQHLCVYGSYSTTQGSVLASFIALPC